MDIGEVHDIAHRGPEGQPLKAKIDAWYMSQLAYFAQALDGSAEGAGTTLDNSLIVMGNAQAEGASHRLDDIPFILVGGAGGALRTGRVVRLGAWASKASDAWAGAERTVTPGQLAAPSVIIKAAP